MQTMVQTYLLQKFGENQQCKTKAFVLFSMHIRNSNASKIIFFNFLRQLLPYKYFIFYDIIIYPSSHRENASVCDVCHFTDDKCVLVNFVTIVLTKRENHT